MLNPNQFVFGKNEIDPETKKFVPDNVSYTSFMGANPKEEIAIQTTGFSPKLEEEIIDDSTSPKMKMGENDIIPTTQEVNSFADFTEEELAELEAGGITSAKKEAASITDKLKKIGKTVVDKGTKVVAGAIGVEAARQLFTEPAAFAKDVVVDTALERGLGMGPGAFVGFAMSPTEMGKSTLDDSPTGEYTTIPLEQNVMKPDDIQEGFINQNQIGENDGRQS
tara:strand:- start:40 stop:708 length:669 start_codon:yes stop_codon:yes gene_type:complete